MCYLVSNITEVVESDKTIFVGHLSLFCTLKDHYH